MGLAVSLVLISTSVFCGCSEDEPGPAQVELPDTSFLKILDLSYTAANDGQRYTCGLQMFWREYYYSDFGDTCKINRHAILNSKSDTIWTLGFDTRFIPAGDAMPGLTQMPKWIDVADSLVAGDYSLVVFYHHSGTDFIFDTTIQVVANLF